MLELSIALVIIGLLIGGVLIGQSLINSAKISAQIKQLQQFDIASANYITKFRVFPGDNDRDGILEGSYHVHQAGSICRAAAGYAYGGDGETFRFFYDLSSRLGFSGNYRAPPGGNTYQGNVVAQPMFGPGNFLPYAAFGRGGIYATHSPNKNLFWVTGTPKNLMNGQTTSWFLSESFTPKEALAMDSKIDDSNSRSGKVSAVIVDGNGIQSTHAPSDPNYAIRFDDNFICSDNTGRYRHTTETRPLCGLQFRSDVSLNSYK